MAKRNTRQMIVDELHARVVAESLSRVRVADLIATLGINRNTFYYHFPSKYDVALCVFRTDLDRELRASVPERELMCAPLAAGGAGAGGTAPGGSAGSAGGRGAGLAYYVRCEIGARTLDASAFLKAMTRCLLADRAFYSKLFTEREPEFTACIRALYYPAFESDIRFILGGRYMPDETLHLLASLCATNLVAIAELCLQAPDGERLLDDRVNPFWNLMHESLAAAIQAHPINRYGR